MSQPTFLAAPGAERLFARLDYMLREGVHIQSNDEQQDYLEFIVANEISLTDYYARFFMLYLQYSGELSKRYYYLEFNNGERGPVGDRHRNFLKAEYVIVGLLLYKLLFNDGHFELNSVAKFQSMLRLDYENLRADVNRLLARMRTAGSSQIGDERIDDVISDAMKEFGRLGWLRFYSDDSFEAQPSIERLGKALCSNH